MSDQQLWSLKYRPSTFAELTGQGITSAVLSALVSSEQVPPALLMCGTHGSGKTTTARIFAAALNCLKAPDGPCLHCVHCDQIRRGADPDVTELDAASHGSAAEVRLLRQSADYAPLSNYRVFLIDEAQSLERDAWNVLLKALEEPPPQSVFVLLTTEPRRIPTTVLSRCMSFEFRRIPSHQIADRLRMVAREEGFAAEDSMIERIAEQASGSMRDALMALDQAHRVGVTELSAYTELIGDVDAGPAIFKAMLYGTRAQVFELVDQVLSRVGDPVEVSNSLVTVLKDVMVLQSGGTSVSRADRMAARAELAGVLPPDKVMAAVQLLWQLSTQVRRDHDSRAMLDLAVALLSDSLRSVVTASVRVAEVSPDAPPRISLSALREVLTQ